MLEEMWPGQTWRSTRHKETIGVKNKEIRIIPEKVTSFLLSSLYFSGEKVVMMHPSDCPMVSTPCGDALCRRGQDWRTIWWVIGIIVFSGWLSSLCGKSEETELQRDWGICLKFHRGCDRSGQVAGSANNWPSQCAGGSGLNLGFRVHIQRSCGVSLVVSGLSQRKKGSCGNAEEERNIWKDSIELFFKV